MSATATSLVSPVASAVTVSPEPMPPAPMRANWTVSFAESLRVDWAAPWANPAMPRPAAVDVKKCLRVLDMDLLKESSLSG